MLGMYANDVLCRVAFGRDFTKGGDYDRQGFHDLLDEYQELLGGLQVGDFFPSLEQIVATVTGMKRRVDSAFKRFDTLFDRIIAEHLDPNRNKDETKDLVDVLLDLHKNSSGDMPLTIENIKALILVSSAS
ncbi:Cytochrome P [Trema orientale]|uniref:Cytochrome P n=1 Tax=Trema orientale TaxID=63057 RepID=A0A2P5AWJ2_TREOI|nr:Cytochrome P [Trema orientale]